MVGVPVSVCVPAFNAARTIVETIESIRAQDFADFEIVVLDNASTDGTGDLVRSFDDERIRLCTNDTVLPMVDNWNRVMSQARGDLVKLVCADDLITPDCLSAQVDSLRDPEVAVAGAKFDVIDDEGAVLARARGLGNLVGRCSSRRALGAFVRKLPDELCPTAAFLFRRHEFEATGGFRTDFFYAMDIDLVARLCARGRFYGHNRVLAINRASVFNHSSTTSTLSKFSDVLRFNHHARREYRGLVGPVDVLAGDGKVLRQALVRLGARTKHLAGRG
ncbi:glycosyltransferase [Nocardia rhizosphaerihabitans]|uniref:Glycosyl hydrolase n=1 Tax=Nocardia rhizosphaerihabitans TaxID=1691570 RepID=A0ABQ2L034_9NOCA|nr:glycosyltransferase [Nocardia rhizosphaerihabitans]GGN98152.1 glycosyl hydrolase [Nocardia rhizosphaerihabitans]